METPLVRPWHARLFGTTAFSWVWWGLAISFPLALIGGDVAFDGITVGVLILLGVWALLEATAWARVDDSNVSWRSLLRRRQVALKAIESCSVERYPFLPGVVPVLVVSQRDGRLLRIRPTLAVGNEARDKFRSAIESRLTHSA